ncbi:helix-turn-helix domain-containing protein [Halalkalibacterium halodurans]|uniref:helix-turn-helix domain-containing protein n=1 Tax=Halalkalibacterium halodurans TaxID=86665 RepID=UPI000315213B|nr:RodZ family helix-turn-helix domain-containing protein [Halalkalibacterium halodurans]MDY7222936.1 RodZ family helix-turn-helix domain-containing protein [Halalkalibacterium halodurans]MDY7242157.1 RodZ family helix-turn-helix domain-containing protein [Halalkalibacterium halodurans]MED3646235.1 helix-turn-helix domain-containing protein [Halalkalibacterium halodurans]MED4080053.1 helix-turn-helix domain-containing protein [Halalkalibacterium halodurans]MED4086820.1 helix-turn-helix domain-
MSELGQRLREIREEKQLSLDDLQRTTKIQKRYLLAIEEGRYDVLPGVFYARAFIKTYAEAVGLDPEQLFDEFSNELPNPQKDLPDRPARSERMKRTAPPVPKKKSKLFSLLPMVAAVAAILLLAIGIWYFAQGNDRAQEPPPEEHDVEAEVGEDPGVEEVEEEEEQPEDNGSDAAEDEQAEEADESELVHIESVGNRSYYELSGTDRFDVEITFDGTSYVAIENGLGNTFFAANAGEGDEQTYDFSGEEEIEFNFGASTFVNLTINDEAFEFPLDTPHQRVNIVFNPSER